MFLGPANRYVRSQGNRAQQGDIDRKAGRREARTSAMTREVRAQGAASARLSGRPLCRRGKAHRCVLSDTTSGISRDVPFFAPVVELVPGSGQATDGPAMEMMRASEKPSMPCESPAGSESNWLN